MQLSVVVPCFNEEKNLAPLFDRLSAACVAAVGEDYEIVLVNDGSTDGTWAGITCLAQGSDHVVGVGLSRNHGHQLALTAGLAVCTGQRILIIDADLQDPPELLGSMITLMDQGADVVYGQRSRRLGETWWKKLSAAAFYRFVGVLTDTKIPPDTGDFRLMSRRALDIFLSMPEQHRFVRGMVSWIGLRQVPLVYEREARHAGSTKYPLHRMIHLALDAITGFSGRPLRFASYLGLLLAGAALVVLAYSLIRWFGGATVPGWTSVMVVVLVLGSAQMVVLGVIGEYLGRLFVESKRRPLFIVDRLIRDGHSVPVHPLDVGRMHRAGRPGGPSEVPHPPLQTASPTTTASAQEGTSPSSRPGVHPSD